MDLGFNEEQEMLRKTAREFLEKECPMAVVRELEASETGFSPQLWRKMAELGWLGLIIPEEYAGSGGNFVDLAALYEEMGRALTPSPHLSTVVLCGRTIQACGSEAQKKELLPKIANGEVIMALALTEPSFGYDPACVSVPAEADGEGYVISGTKLFVQHAHIADYLLCVARTQKSADPAEGITLFLVDAKAPGVAITTLAATAGNKPCEVVFDNVRVPKSSVVGEPNKGWAPLAKALQEAAVMQSVEMMGGAQRAVEMSVEYAKVRVQYGRPIGSFQAIQYKCVDMAVDVSAGRLVAYKAAARLAGGQPCTKEVAMAKACASDVYQRTALEAHMIHAGVGFASIHDLQLYFRRAKAAETYLGDADFHRGVLAEQMAL